MANVPVEIRDFEGLLPLIDRKRVAKPFVCDGRNFIVDLDGPYSAFGRRLVTHRAFPDPYGVQSLRVGSDLSSFYFTSSGILAYKSTENVFVPVFEFPKQNDVLPFTTALVGSKQYFARRGVGLLQFDQQTGVWKKVTGGDTPPDVVAVTQSGSRLIALNDSAVFWSEIDNGEGWTPSIDTGAGFQSLSLIDSTCVCSAQTVINYPGGFLTYTTRGIMRSENVVAQNPFRHRVLSRKHIALNPWCVVYDDQNELHILMSKSGLFSTDGFELPQTWQPALSEYLRRAVIPKRDLTKDAVLRLSYNFERSWFYVSISDNDVDGLYTRAYVLYTPGNRWGIFNNLHTSIIEVHFERGAFFGYQLGYVNVEGSMFAYNDNAFDVLYPQPAEGQTDTFYDFRLPTAENPPRYDNTSVVRMPSKFRMRGRDESRMYALGVAGIYDLASTNDVTDRSQDPDPINVNAPPGEFYAKFYDASGQIFYTLKTINSQLPFKLADGTDKNISLVEVTKIPFFLANGTPANIQTGIMFASIIGFAGGIRQLSIGLALAESQQQPLDSFIEVGPFRIPSEEGIDILAQMDELFVSMLEERITDTLEDYIADYTDDVFEDWDTMLDAEGNDIEEDWGFGNPDSSQYATYVRGTIDAYNTWQEQEEAPTILEQQDRTRHMSATNGGLYHLITMATENVGDSYHLKTVQINFIGLGKLT